MGPVVMSQMRKIRGPVVPGTAEVLSLRCLSRPSRSKPTHTGRALVQVKSYRRQPQSRRVSGCRRPEVVRPPRDDTSQPWQDSQHGGSHRRTALHTRGRAPLPGTWRRLRLGPCSQYSLLRRPTSLSASHRCARSTQLTRCADLSWIGKRPNPFLGIGVKPEQYQNVWRPTRGALHKGRVLSVPNICRSRRNPATARGGRHAMTGIRGPRRCERKRATNLNGSDTCRARQMPSAAAPARRPRVFVR